MKTLHLQLEDETHKKLKLLAAEKEMSMKDLIIYLLPFDEMPTATPVIYDKTAKEITAQPAPAESSTNSPDVPSSPGVQDSPNSPNVESKPDQIPEHLMEHIISSGAYEKPKAPTRKVVAADGNEYEVPLHASVSADGESYITGKFSEAPLPEYPKMTFGVMDDYFPVDAPRDITALRKFLAEKAEHLEMTMDEMVEDMLQ